MNVARMCGGIIMMAGPEPLLDIWPLGVMARFLPKLMVAFVFICVVLLCDGAPFSFSHLSSRSKRSIIDLSSSVCACEFQLVLAHTTFSFLIWMTIELVLFTSMLF